MTKPFDPSKPVQTRDGRKARIVCTDMKADHGTILALVTHRERKEYEHILFVNMNGQVLEDDLCASDLINIPERTSRWAKISHSTGYADRDVAITAWHPENEQIVLLEIISEDGKPVDVKLHKDEK